MGNTKGVVCALAVLTAALAVGCGSDGGDGTSGSGGEGGEASGTAGAGPGPGGAGPVGPGGSGPASGGSGPASGGSGPSSGGTGPGGAGNGGAGPCEGASNVDDDGDGFDETQGDCNDCDVNTNPGAVDVISVDANGDALPANQQFDEDCDGSPALPGDASCDNSAALTIDSNDAIHGANAMDICKVSQNGSWGIVSAQYVQVDLSPLPNPIGHGLLSAFGSLVSPQNGVKMLALSSGTARQPTDPGYQDVGGYDKTYTSAHPPGFPIESAACPGVTTGTPHDSAALKLELKVPTNAKSLSFKFKFHTYEFPGYICSVYNDFFVALMDPPPIDVDPINKNIAFDGSGNPISVNNALLDVCTPGTYGGKVFACPGDINELVGTGFDAHGATSWLQTNAPVTPGSVITLTFGAYDSGDGVLDSTVLVDDFQWSANPAQTGTEDACLSGGTRTCDVCVIDAIESEGCCDDAWTACQGNAACSSLSSCVSLCGNQVCIDGCLANYPAGVALYQGALDCLYGQGAADVGACGLVCD